jgi:hypothetical protein
LDRGSPIAIQPLELLDRGSSALELLAAETEAL